MYFTSGRWPAPREAAVGSTAAPGSAQWQRTWATARAYTTRPSLKAAFTTNARTALRLAGCLASKLQGRGKLCATAGLWLRLGECPQAKSAGAMAISPAAPWQALPPSSSQQQSPWAGDPCRCQGERIYGVHHRTCLHWVQTFQLRTSTDNLAG